ncbi:MAG: hypothetical protein IIZ17_08675 [Eubacteriaceae bacterium]|nr:hypothetical protein [Eubacteriaceae bacterium]MBQ1466734.1 hypothetical protein [Eubacteriaceae bacterium]MBR2781227.1 hypothetical protein [Eubacteriaceae bacterium]MCR4894180.1 hypothetical protein [Eubacteriales bacterium]
MLSVFDVYDYLPRTDCGKCVQGSCMAMARAVSEGKLKVTECTWVSEDDPVYAELFDIIREECGED